MDALWNPLCQKLLCSSHDKQICSSWKSHYLNVIQSIKILGPTRMLSIGFDEVILLKKNSPRLVWEERILSVLEHSLCAIRLDRSIKETVSGEVYLSFLHWAVANGSCPLVRHIVKCGGGVIFQKSNVDYSPLHLAAFLGKEEIVEFLLKWACSTDILVHKNQLQSTSIFFFSFPRKLTNVSNVSLFLRNHRVH